MRDPILEHLRIAAEHLRKARMLVEEANKDGKQWDMTNQPDSYALDLCEMLSSKISNIYYQEVS